MTRTFSREHWQAAQAAWAGGQFSEEWREYRHQAAMRGMLYPPEGTRWDSWEDEEPSQRAILVQGIRNTPALLHEAIGRSKSWFEVVDYILRRRAAWREELWEREQTERADKADEPTYREAVQSIAAIVHRIGELVP